MVSGHWPKAIWSSHLANVFYSTIRNLYDYFAIRARANKKRNTINKQWKGTKRNRSESNPRWFSIEWEKTTHVYSMMFTTFRNRERRRRKKASRKFFTFRRESERRKNGVSIHTKKFKSLYTRYHNNAGIFIAWISTYIFINDTSE